MYIQSRDYRVVQVVQDATTLKLEGRICNVPGRKLNLVLKSRIINKYYLNLFSITYENKEGRPDRSERSTGILMGQIVSLYMLRKGGGLYCPKIRLATGIRNTVRKLAKLSCLPKKNLVFFIFKVIPLE